VECRAPPARRQCYRRRQSTDDDDRRQRAKQYWPIKWASNNVRPLGYMSNYKDISVWYKTARNVCKFNGLKCCTAIHYHVMLNRQSHCEHNKAIVDIRLRLRCAIPPLLRPTIDSSNDCNPASAPAVWTPLHGRVQFAIHRVLGLLATCLLPKLPIPLLGSSSHVTHCSSSVSRRKPRPLIITNDISIGSAFL